MKILRGLKFRLKLSTDTAYIDHNTNLSCSGYKKTNQPKHEIGRRPQTRTAKDGSDNQCVDYNGEWGSHDVNDGCYQVRGVTLRDLSEVWIRKMETGKTIDRDVASHLLGSVNELVSALVQ
ncbi:hypothetical protein ACROYT_G043476 [Oculina patagonica]